MSEWLTRKQTADMLGVCQQTLLRMMQAGKINYYKSGTSRTCKVLFRKEDVLKYLKSIKK